MSLNCLNNIITDNLAINIDISNINSWNLNNNLSLVSLNKWKDSLSSDIDLIDYGLTMFDNGATNVMWSGITLNSNDVYLNLNRIGENVITYPSSGNTNYLFSAATDYTNYTITSITGETVGNYFNLNGGYLQGYYKLFGYDYELLPKRFINGCTIETLIRINNNSQGIFYLMGIRSEDKYNIYFSGETINIDNNINGVFTSENNYLDSEMEYTTTNSSFIRPEEKNVVAYSSTTQIDNIKNNIIAFEITNNKKIGYKYINNNGKLIQNYSDSQLNTGWTLISITYKPYTNILIDEIDCELQRFGDLMFYVNGRLFWKVKDFPEIMFHEINNDKEKQIGVPYNISWGGGSFGLKNSWHYDYKTNYLYNSDDDTYINNNFVVEDTPINNNCNTNIGFNYNNIILSSNSTKFQEIDPCDNNVYHPVTVLEITNSGFTGNSFYVKFNKEFHVLSNRKYEINLNIYDDGIFNYLNTNKLSVLVYGTSNVYVIDDVEYNYPTKNNKEWINLNSTFTVENNSGEEIIYVGLLFETNIGLNFLNDGKLYIRDYNIVGQDSISKDDNKSNLIVEKYFDSSYVGDIQKLRIYDTVLLSNEILHNAWIEAKNNPYLEMIVSKGGRVINSNIPISIPTPTPTPIVPTPTTISGEFTLLNNATETIVAGDVQEFNRYLVEYGVIRNGFVVNGNFDFIYNGGNITITNDVQYGNNLGLSVNVDLDSLNINMINLIFTLNDNTYDSNVEYTIIRSMI